MSRLDKPLSEVLTEWEQSMREDGITDCRSHQWLKANVNTGTVADFDAWIAQDHTEGPSICWQVIRDSYRHSKTPQEAHEVQRACVQTLCNYPFNVGRAAIQMVFMNPLRGGHLDPQAKQMLIQHMLKHHRKAKAYFSQDFIRPNVPELDVESLPDDSAD